MRLPVLCRFNMLKLSIRAISSAATPWPLLVRITARHFAATRNVIDASEEELQVARKWLANLHTETIPKSVGELSYSRSSGPGGQNVNKYALYAPFECLTILKYIQE